MKLRTPFIALVAAVSTLALTNCGDKPNKKARGDIHFIKGDPAVFFKNTANHPGGTIPETIVNSGSEWTLTISGFSNQGVRRRRGNLTDGQEPGRQRSSGATAEPTAAGEGYKFIRETGSSIVLNSSAANAVRLKFRIENGVLNLDSFTFRGNTDYVGRDFQVIHNSSSPQGDAHSVLIYGGTGRKKMLYSLVFREVKRPSIAAEITSKAYEFMFGSGVKVAWPNDRPLELQMCQPALPILIHMFDESLKEWNRVLRGRLTVQRGALTQCPPFSDVNTQTVHVIEDWIEVIGADTMTAGLALVLRKEDKPELADADIFIMLGEWDEVVRHKRGGGKVDEDFIRYNYFGYNRVSQVLQRTFTHEVGHALGLHHKFDGTPSMMAYQDFATTLYDYDRRAIQALYPVNPNLRQAGHPGSFQDRYAGSSPYPAVERNPYPAGSSEWSRWELERILRENQRDRERSRRY